MVTPAPSGPLAALETGDQRRRRQAKPGLHAGALCKEPLCPEQRVPPAGWVRGWRAGVLSLLGHRGAKNPHRATPQHKIVVYSC